MATQNAVNVGIVPGGGFTYTFPSATSTLYGTGTGTITSSQLATSLTDETGSGAAVFGTSPTIATPKITIRTASSTTASTLTPDLSTATTYFRTTQTATLTINAPTNATIGDTIAIYVDSVGAQTLTINATYVAFGSAFPATTTAGKTFMLVAQYTGSVWRSTWNNAV